MFRDTNGGSGSLFFFCPLFASPSARSSSQSRARAPPRRQRGHHVWATRNRATRNKRGRGGRTAGVTKIQRRRARASPPSGPRCAARTVFGRLSSAASSATRVRRPARNWRRFSGGARASSELFSFLTEPATRYDIILIRAFTADSSCRILLYLNQD